MKGSSKTWIVLGALAIVAAALLILELRGALPRSSSEEVEYVWDIETTDVVAVRVTNNISGTVTAVERNAAGEWQVTEPSPGAASHTDCTTLAYYLSTLQVEQTIETPPAAEMEAYGLITPTYTVEVRLGDGNTLTLEVGNRAVSGYYYARRAGEEAVLLVTGYVVDEIVRIVESPPYEATPTPPMPSMLGPESPDG
jgi:hypothetical protein